MKIAGKKPWYLEYLLIIVGTGLMGTAITSCFDAAGMVTGGFSGIAILVKAWTKGLYGNGIPLWITNLILNVPLFLLATKIKGFAFVRKALLGDISLTIWLAILPAWNCLKIFSLSRYMAVFCRELELDLYFSVVERLAEQICWLQSSRNICDIILLHRSCSL